MDLGEPLEKRLIEHPRLARLGTRPVVRRQDDWPDIFFRPGGKRRGADVHVGRATGDSAGGLLGAEVRTDGACTGDDL